MTSSKFCNRLFLGCGIAGMKTLDANSVPLCVTSPPYGTMRDYGGHEFHFRPMARELWRVIADGGVVCWHTQDQLAEGSESGESIRQAMYFLEQGFNLHTTLTIEGSVIGKYRHRYGQPVQYLFVFSKGKVRTFSPIEDVPNRDAGKIGRFKERTPEGTRNFRQMTRIKPFRKRGVHWKYNVGTHNTPDRDAREHPALMPEELARDLILSWSKEGDLVLDPMGGAATTAKVAFLNNRRFISYEINPEYHNIAVARIEETYRKVQQNIGANSECNHDKEANNHDLVTIK